jgi:membrane dipeptidase
VNRWYFLRLDAAGSTIPAGLDYLEDVSCFPYITQVLLNRGYKDEAIHKILGGNFLRVFRMAEEKAERRRT